MAPKVTRFGPGELTLGVTPTELDISCQLITAQLEVSKDKDDDEETLCGDVVAGQTTYTAQLTGEMFQDVADAAGILFYSWAHAGEEVPFTFTPNTAAGAAAAGTLTIDPLPFGSDEAKANMRSDFTWDCVGLPTLTPGTPVGLEADTEAAPDAAAA